jgi:PAS domain S-box-containing protein
MHAPDAVVVIDASGRIVATSPQALRLFGYSEHELRGHSIETLVPERFRLKHERHRVSYRVNPAPRPMGSGLDLRARHADGTEFPVEISLSPLRHKGRTLVSAAVRDVTDRKLVHDTLRSTRDTLNAELTAQLAERERDIDQMQRQAEMLDLASEPIFAWDMDRGIVFWNKAATETYGYSREAAIGRNSHQLLATTHPEGTAQIRHALVRDGRWDGELVHTTRDGRRIVMESRMALVTTRAGDRLVLESCRDITARRAAEEGLRQAQKMEAVGQLTGGIAHDFNNLLTIILANLQLLEDELAPGSPPLELAGSATRAAQRGADLTRKQLIFARRQRLESAPLDINELVSSMTGMLTRTLGENIRIVESLNPKLPKVLIDAGQLETALLNLAINARDAMAQGGRLTIATEDVIVDANDERRASGLAPGAYVSVAVSDTGAGMTREVMARAFEPFFTTKEAGRGTGLGLSMVYGFVKQSGGHVSLHSDPGYGTTVKLYLPQATKSEVTAAAAPVVHPTGSETILLVEDDDDVRQATRKLLAGLGYRVVEAADAKTALSLLAQHDGVDLLLTDVVLAQGMSGPELAREVRRSSPDMKILFMSGHVRDTAAFHEQLQQDAHFLAKPFRKAELAQKLRLALGTRER